MMLCLVVLTDFDLQILVARWTSSLAMTQIIWIRVSPMVRPVERLTSCSSVTIIDSTLWDDPLVNLAIGLPQ